MKSLAAAPEVLLAASCPTAPLAHLAGFVVGNRVVTPGRAASAPLLPAGGRRPGSVVARLRDLPVSSRPLGGGGRARACRCARRWCGSASASSCAPLDVMTRNRLRAPASRMMRRALGCGAYYWKAAAVSGLVIAVLPPGCTIGRALTNGAPLPLCQGAQKERTGAGVRLCCLVSAIYANKDRK